MENHECDGEIVMNRMREEFEKWAAGDGYELEVSDDERFTYSYHETECAWYGWKASRAALCVELPDAETGFDGDSIFATGDIHDALDVAGVRYK